MVVILSLTIIIKLLTQAIPLKSRIKRRTFNIILALTLSLGVIIWLFPEAIEMLSWLRDVGEKTGEELPDAFNDFLLIWVFWQFIPVLLFVLWDYNPNTEWLGGRLAIISDGSLGIRHTILVDRTSGQTLIVDIDRAQMIGDKIYLTASGHYFLVDLKTMKIIAYKKGRDIPSEYRKGFKTICWPLI